MKNFEFPASLFFEKIPKWRGWKDIFYFFFFLHFTDLLSVHVRSAGTKAYSLKTRGGKIPVTVTWPEMELENVEVGNGL